MTLEHFLNEAISPWMRKEGTDSDIVLSSRIRLARNFANVMYPILGKEDELKKVHDFMKDTYNKTSFQDYTDFHFISTKNLSEIENQILIEKHLVSPSLTRYPQSAALISKNEQVSIMINEEDHLRIQLYFPGYQLADGLKQASQLDDWIEGKVDYAFDEKFGYLTSCPTNVGTGMRASVMMHLPALVITKQMSRMIPAINQFGLVVRGIYGEGSESLGNIFQISNQITLGKSEKDIVFDLASVVKQLIEQERLARSYITEQLGISLEDRIFRSYGTMKNARIIESKEAAKCISNVRLGIDLGIIENISKNILNELMTLTQPGFLQYYANRRLTPRERDVFRASLIRERLELEK
ncbi:protein arginine kinase [Oceanobacillus alkalisoli]|uniref:protein arginine kinase n=1 Tax=Oceanobacillus alkalisoli TaxID=2925113 RepID=UPI001EEFB997|nr:protein arginine kinase [Oceanobacillus alkalisoli]MCF3943845.1 protein arginine kinase [Oceanobacillus alkalisoli]MCG5104650.1 protein arginine kinase [Oceanobacillus alkalisoli]